MSLPHMVATAVDFIIDRFSEPVSDDIAACIDCNALECGGEKFATCPKRLERLATLSEMTKTKE